MLSTLFTFTFKTFSSSFIVVINPGFLETLFKLDITFKTIVFASFNSYPYCVTSALYASAGSSRFLYISLIKLVIEFIF